MGLLDKLKKKKDEEEVSVKDAKIVDDKKDNKKEIKSTSEKTEEKKEAKTEEKKDSKKDNKKISINSVILRAQVSEKTANLESNGVYTFIVKPSANKYTVKESVKQIYGITPKKIRIINTEGKRVRFGYRQGKRSDWKKAIVTLPKGKTINIHEGV
jgi:large subunit ribosomal protein L23